METEKFKTIKFHEACDGIRGTIVIFKTTEGSIFGGKIDLTWDMGTCTKKDQETFLFRFKKNDYHKFTKKNYNWSSNCYSNDGPHFGIGDIVIDDRGSSGRSTLEVFWKFNG